MSTGALRQVRRGFQRSLLWRRKIDGPLLAFGLATFFIDSKLSAIVLGVFTGIGVYLLALRWKTWRRIDGPYAVATLVIAVGATAIGLANGSLPGDWRYGSYPLYYLALLPIGAGFILVRDPLRMIVAGTRVALLLLAAWALYEMATVPSRHGFGSNPANAAFAICVFAIFSRLNVEGLPRLLANRHAYFYLALIPLLATGIRTVMPVFVAGIVLDLWTLYRYGRDGETPRGSRLLPMAATATLLLLITGWFALPLVEARMDATAIDIEAVDSDLPPETSLGVRLAQWDIARQVIAAKPWLGHGGEGAIAAQFRRIPEASMTALSPHPFSHNAVLDEWMQRGFFGLVLTFGFLVFSFHRVYVKGRADIRQATILMAVLVTCFGMLHYLLLIDRNVALIALFFAIMTTANRGFHPPFRD